MLKKLFSNQQLSLFFQIAISMQVISLISNLIIYHYYPNAFIIKNVLQIINEVSLFMMCLIIISQTLFIIQNKHKIFIDRYKLLSLTIALVIAMFIFWLLAIDNDIQEEFIIFLSKTSVTEHSYEVIIILLAIFAMLIYDLYNTIKEQETINEKTVPEIIRSTFRLVIKEHLFIFIAIFGVFHIKKIHQFASSLFEYTKISAITDLKFLEILIPITWLFAVSYYVYHRFYQKSKKIKPHHTRK